MAFLHIKGMLLHNLKRKSFGDVRRCCMCKGRETGGLCMCGTAQTPHPCLEGNFLFCMPASSCKLTANLYHLNFRDVSWICIESGSGWWCRADTRHDFAEDQNVTLDEDEELLQYDTAELPLQVRTQLLQTINLKS